MADFEAELLAKVRQMCRELGIPELNPEAPQLHRLDPRLEERMRTELGVVPNPWTLGDVQGYS